MAHFEAPIGRTKVYEETFKSPHGRPTIGEAEQVLNAIREAHPASSGWVELGSGIEQRSVENSQTVLFYAWRKHAKYR